MLCEPARRSAHPGRRKGLLLRKTTDYGRLTPALIALGAARTRTYGIIARHYRQRSTDQAILSQLGLLDEMTNGQLARMLGMSTGGVTPAVDRLERRGLVERRPNPVDRRSSMLRLTDDGREMMAAGTRMVADAICEIEDRLTDREIGVVLEVVAAAISGYDDAAMRLTSRGEEVSRWREIETPSV